MGNIIESIRRHYVGDDADKDSIPAGAKSFGDSYHANDKGKQYYWNGAAWKTGLGYEYVPRDVAAYDFEAGAFTIDGNAHVNGLDVSGIVPAGAVAVQLVFYIFGPANRLGKIYKNAANPKSEIHLTTNVVNLDIWTSGPVGCESDRLLDYQFAVGITAIGVSVVGWFI